MTAAIPVLWLTGAPGAGKTAVAWQLYSQLKTQGRPVGFLDIDQVGMITPDPPADRDRHRIKAVNAEAVIQNFRAVGAEGVIVSGVVDPRRGVLRELMPSSEITCCLLRAQPTQLAARYVSRAESPELLPAIVAYAEELDRAAFADVVFDTDAVAVADVAGMVGLSTRWLSDRPVSGSQGAHPTTTAGGDVLWISGPMGVGKSTVGFAAYLGASAAGEAKAFLDADQLAFVGDALDHRLRASNVAAIWENFFASGAKRLIVVGPVENRSAAAAYERAMPSASFTWLRLQADGQTLTERIRQRGRRGSWPQPGDPLLGQPPVVLQAWAERATAQSAALDKDGVGIPIPTAGKQIAELADAVVSLWDDAMTLPTRRGSG